MAAENGKKNTELPLEMELDLLVDEELPETRRGDLLRSLDKAPEHWRDLSIRFLERQVEKKSVRQLIADASFLPSAQSADAAPPPASHRSPGVSWLTPTRFAAIAAGLLIAVGSALVTTYVIQRAQSTPTPSRVATNAPSDVITTFLPASVVGMDKGSIPVQLSVSDASEKSGPMTFFPPASADEAGTRRSVVIKPDGLDNALVIPVKNLQFQ